MTLKNHFWVNLTDGIGWTNIGHPMTSRSTLTKIPRSGDALTDWMYRQFVSMLNDENLVVYRMRRLHDPADRRRRALRGIMDPYIHPSGKHIQIIVNPARSANRNWVQEVETLVHELTHVLMERTRERGIVQLEKILAKNITLEQKRYLRMFLPDETIHQYPTSFPELFPRPAFAAQKKRTLSKKK